MANLVYLNRQLIQNFARLHIHTVHQPTLQRSPVSWVRTITSTPSRSKQSSFTVSFGVENDALLAPHLQKLKEKEDKARARKNGKSAARNTLEREDASPTITRTSQAIVADDFEIDDYVDLSVKKPRRSETGDARSQKSDAELTEDSAQMDSSSNKKKRTPAPKDTVNARKQSSADDSGKRRDRPNGTGMISKSSSGQNLIPKKREPWQAQKNTLKEKFGEDGWNPRKKLSPDAIEGIRGLHEQDPVKYSTEVLSAQFKVSPEAIRRMLKSKWSQKISPDKMQERRERWARRHDRIWDRQAALGLRPERVKDRDIEDPDQFEKDMIRKQTLGEI